MTPALYDSASAKYEVSGAYPDPVHDQIPQGMRILTLEVDNNTFTSIYLPDLGRWVPPQTAGWRGRCNGLTQINAVFQSPPGVSQPVSTAGMSIILIAHADLLDPSPGVAYSTSLLTNIALGKVDQGNPNAGGALAWPVDIDAIDDAVSLGIKPTASLATDFSGTVVAGGTPQNIAPINALRRYFQLQNPNAATEPLYFSVTGAAVPGGGAGTYELMPGQIAWFNGPRVPSDAVSVVAATNGHRYVATGIES